MYTVEVSVTDLSEFRPLRSWLERIPGIDVVLTSFGEQEGMQGGWDVLTILASSSGGIAIAIHSLPEFVRSRRKDVAINIKIGDREVTLQAANAENAVEVIEAVLRETGNGETN